MIYEPYTKETTILTRDNSQPRFGAKLIFIVLFSICFFSQSCAWFTDWNRELCEAAWDGDLALARKALKAGASLNFKNPKDRLGTPLHGAVKNGHHRMVEYLLKERAFVSIRDLDDNTALYYGAEFLRLKSVALLLRPRGDIDRRNKRGWSALYPAAAGSRTGNLKMVRLLLAHGANIHVRDIEKKLAYDIALREAQRLKGANGYSESEKTLRFRNNGEIIKLLGKKEDLALFKYVKSGNLAGLKLVLERGGDVNLRGEDGKSALMNASERGRAKVVECLLKYNAALEMRSESGATALLFASRRGDLAIVKMLLEAGADMSQVDHRSSTPLIAVAIHDFRNSFQILRIFIESGGDLNRGNAYGTTALMSAVIGDKPRAVAMLLEAGAEVDHRDMFRRTALMMALEYGHSQNAKLLLGKGADVNAIVNSKRSYKYKWSVLMFGVGYKWPKSLETLEIALKAGAKVNARNNYGQTALMLAVLEKQETFIPLLLRYGADVSIKDERGLTALDYARKMELDKIVKMLMEQK